eukprot:SAG11_NODE_174_length_13505_cov_9.126585_11_plen_245_part_00
MNNAAKSSAGQRLLNRLKTWTRTSRDLDEAALKVLFNEMDTGGDGTINSMEFQALMSKTGSAMSLGELSKAFEEMDADHSGEIDFEEFLGFYNHLSTKTAASKKLRDQLKKHVRDARLSQEQVRELFDEIDDDQNGFIDKTEFQALMGKLGVVFTRNEVEMIFSDMDEDRSGVIEWLEFWNFLVDGGEGGAAGKLKSKIKSIAIGTESVLATSKRLKKRLGGTSNSKGASLLCASIHSNTIVPK